MPIRMGKAAFAFVFEKFIHRRKKDAGAARVDPHIEIEFVFEKLHIAVTDHSEKLSGAVKTVGVNPAILDREGRIGVSRHAVADARNYFCEQIGKRSENGNREDVAVSHSNLP